MRIGAKILAATLLGGFLFNSVAQGAVGSSLLGARQTFLQKAWTAQQAGQNSWQPVAGRYNTLEEIMEAITANMGWSASQRAFFIQMQDELNSQLKYILSKEDERDSGGTGYQNPDMGASDFLGEEINSLAPETAAVVDGIAKKKRKANVPPQILKGEVGISAEDWMKAQAMYNLAVKISNDTYTPSYQMGKL